MPWLIMLTTTCILDEGNPQQTRTKSAVDLVLGRRRYSRREGRGRFLQQICMHSAITPRRETCTLNLVPHVIMELRCDIRLNYSRCSLGILHSNFHLGHIEYISLPLPWYHGLCKLQSVICGPISPAQAHHTKPETRNP